MYNLTFCSIELADEFVEQCGMVVRMSTANGWISGDWVKGIPYMPQALGNPWIRCARYCFCFATHQCCDLDSTRTE